MLDAKYIAVKGHHRKLASIWAVDYLTHDILYRSLVPEENYLAYSLCLKFLRKIGYPVKAVICDEHQAIIQSTCDIFPKAKIQICHTHVLRNIQKLLNVRYEHYDLLFFKDVQKLFKSNTLGEYSTQGRYLIEKHYKNPLHHRILIDIEQKHQYLTTYLEKQGCPRTNNLIEGYNSHLATRLKSMHGFESYESANIWLNAYTLYKRLTPFTDCRGKFRELNGNAPLFFTIEDDGPRRKILKYFGRDFCV